MVAKHCQGTRRLLNTLGLFSTVFITLLALPAISNAGALENYVNQPDTSYNWKRTEQTKIDKATVTHLELVSQTWRGQFWSHHLQIVRPIQVRNPGIALIFITGDGDGARDLEMLNLLAQRAGTITAVLTKVPNQPLYDGRKEDSLIAYTLDQYLKTGDETWPLLFPMVKSAIRGMDAVQALAEKEFNQKIEKFVVTGASKRGWTTWLAAAVDPRVKAIAPMVIDMLNMKAQLQWAEKCYGKQSEQISDYTDLNLHRQLDDPPMQKLRSWIDPYSYRDRYTMPKLLLLGTNDPYWVVDSLRHYWNDLPEPKLVFQTPNAGHNLGGAKDATQTLAAWFQMIADGQELPRVEWKLYAGSLADSKLYAYAKGPASISAHVSSRANKARLWTAHSDNRDFRNAKWTSEDHPELKPEAVGLATEVLVPEKGFTAFMGEFELTSPTGDTYKLSTQVQVTPDNVK